MKKCVILIGIVLLAGSITAETYQFTPAISRRKIKVVRNYKIMVQPNQTNVAQLPAMISFQGATNEQIIESSVFMFSIKPDQITVVCHDLGMPRKMYQMIWEKPSAIHIEVKQEMIVSMIARNRLFTTAKLPYSEQVMKACKSCLGKYKDGDINPDNPVLGPICEEIVKDSRDAEQVVSGVCDWIADHIKLTKGKGEGSDETLEKREGNSFGLANLTCSMLRRIGIPSDRVRCKYVDGSGGYFIIEVYFPDAGWVFYDVGWPERGFKSLDGLIASGWAYRLENDPSRGLEWVEGNFCEEWDIMKYQEPDSVTKKVIRPMPQQKDALSVMVSHAKPPASLPVRQRSLRDLLLDKETPVPPVVEKNVSDKSGAFDSDRPKNRVKKEKEG